MYWDSVYINAAREEQVNSYSSMNTHYVKHSYGQMVSQFSLFECVYLILLLLFNGQKKCIHKQNVTHESEQGSTMLKQKRA